MKLLATKSINYSDVNIIADRPSVVSSRDEVDFNPNRIIVAPMSAIQNETFNLAAIASGISLPIHRFCSTEDQHRLLKSAIKHKQLLNSKSILWLSVGLRDFKDRVDPVRDLMKESEVGILLDVANGYAFNVKEAITSINTLYPELPNLMTGNVHSYGGFEFLESLHSRFIRLGVANGQACDTRLKTGVVRGQISCIKEVSYRAMTAAIVADGGIRCPADVAKAHGAGADYTMVGGWFAQAAESEAQIKGSFYGGASAKQKELAKAPKDRYIEGKELQVLKSNTTLQEIVTDICDGVKSCISYSGYDSLDAFIGNAVFELNIL